MYISKFLTRGQHDSSQMNPLVRFVRNFVYGFNFTKYWRRRMIATGTNASANVLWKLYCLYYCKKIEIKMTASMGTIYNGGATFITPPHLPHGMYGIIVGHDAQIGSDVTIFHQVTIAHGNVVIGDNVVIGAGAKILPAVHIGSNAKIGANCVVVEDIPEGATCVMQKPRVILKTNNA